MPHPLNCSLLGVITFCGNISYQYFGNAKSACHTELWDSELSCREWLVRHDISSGQRCAVDRDTCKEQCQQLLLLRHRPSRGVFLGLRHLVVSTKEITNGDLFFSDLLALSYQVRFAWICFQGTSPGCVLLSVERIFSLGFYTCGKGLFLDLFLGELVPFSLLQITHAPYRS